MQDAVGCGDFDIAEPGQVRWEAELQRLAQDKVTFAFVFCLASNCEPEFCSQYITIQHKYSIIRTHSWLQYGVLNALNENAGESERQHLASRRLYCLYWSVHFELPPDAGT